MSYDLEFNCELETPHHIKGGTYALGGTPRPELNITYNYGRIFCTFLEDPKGIRSLYGKTAAEVIARLDEVIPKMQGRPDDDYWAATEGNARQALVNLRDLAKMCPPDAILDGD